MALAEQKSEAGGRPPVNFVDPSVGGYNGKSTQTTGVEASRLNGYLGIDGVRYVTRNTMTYRSVSTRILGGAQFNTSFSDTAKHTGVEGCWTDGCENTNTVGTYTITPQQAAYNALEVFFNETPVAQTPIVESPPVLGGTTWDFNGTPGVAPLNYLQIYYEDIQYATQTTTTASVEQCGLAAGGWLSPVCPDTSWPTSPLSAQNLLDAARAQLLKIAEHETTCINEYTCLF